MILNNFKKMAVAICGAIYTSNTYIKNYNGDVSNVNTNSSTSSFLMNYAYGLNDTNYKTGDYLRNGYGLLLGTGGGEITENDYCMFELYSDYTALSGTSTFMIGSNYYDSGDILTVVKTIKNTSNSPVTITEMGLVSRAEDYGNSPYVLLTHDLLETPVTLEPDDMYTFTLRIKL